MAVRVLVAYATRHGSTAEIAEAIGLALGEQGITAEVRDAGTVRDVAGYDALIVGSAVYAGRWRGEAVALLERIAREPARHAVWVFQSGPLSSAPEEAEQPLPVNVQLLVERLGVRGVVTFGGALLPGTPGIFEWLMLRGGGGDYRDWAEIGEWAHAVAADLARLPAATGPGRATVLTTAG